MDSCDLVIPDNPDIVSDQVAVGFIHRLAKNELKYIVLALLLDKPRCGTDIIKTVHAKFGLLLSPGTVYPLLHNLEKIGLIEHDRGKKVKLYRPVKEREKVIRQMIDSRVSAMKIIIDFLKPGSKSRG